MRSICNFTFSQNASLKIHIESVHKNKETCLIYLSAQFVIIFCSQKYDLQKHTESVHEKCKLQKCSICDFNCSQKGNSKGFIGSVHENKKSCAQFAISVFL